MVTVVVVLFLFTLFVVACVVGFFAGLCLFVLSVQLERQRVAPFGEPAWVTFIWPTWSYTPSTLTLEGQRILPKWRKTKVVFYACLVIAPLSASLAYLLSGKANPLLAVQAPNPSIERTVFGQHLASQLRLALVSEGDMLCGLCVRLSGSSVSPSILTTCSTSRASRAGHPIASRLGAG